MMSPEAGIARSPRSRRARRYREVMRVLWEERIYSVVRAVGMEQDAAGILAGEEAEPPGSAATGGRTGEEHAPSEVRLRRALERLGPAFVKIGQMLSTRRDLIAPKLAGELAKLQDEVAVTPWGEMAQVLTEELGATVDELYEEFDTTPLAAASIGQVYRARLHDGRAVAVKIQRPGARDAIETDLDILLSWARFLAHRSEWARERDVPAIAADIAHVLRAELDYLHEARCLRAFRDAFEGSEEVFFPAPVVDLTTSRVLTMEMVDGIPGSRPEELRAAGVDTGLMVRRGVESYFRQIFEMGMYHADPHAGNLYALPDGRVGFVDFGRVAVISRGHRRAVFDMLVAVMDDEPADAAEALLDMATAGPGLEVAELQADLAHVASLYREGQRRRDVLQVTLRETLTTVRKHRLNVSSDIVQLITTLGVLEGVASQLHPGFSVIEAAKPFTEHLLATSLAPRVWQDEAMRALRRYRRLLEDLPVAVTRVLRRAGEGEFKVGVRPEGYQDAMRRLHEMVDTLALSILAAAFVLAFAYLTAQDALAEWARAAAAVVLALSALLAVWLLVSIVSVARRRRRR